MNPLAASRRIADTLLAEAHEKEDGSLSWGRGAGSDRQPVADSGPFNGRCGEAMLFAALARATGDSAYAEAALLTLGGLRRNLPAKSYRERLAGEINLGLSGLGGILYALVRIADWLDEPELIQLATQLAEALTPDLIEADLKIDIIWGSSGALLGLLALAEKGVDVFARAERCATQILTQRSADPSSGLHAWLTLKAVPSTGFAHGASGMAHALLCWYRHSRDRACYQAAIEAFAFERDLYSVERRNWLSSGVEEQDSPMMWSWCHGAPGIALGRLAALDFLEEDDETLVAEDLSKALTHTLAAQTPNVDTICCGHFGRVDILIEASRLLGNESLAEHARVISTERLQDAEKNGGFTMSQKSEFQDDKHLEPGFWQGQSGTAYTLLRLVDLETFPSVLAMA